MHSVIALLMASTMVGAAEPSKPIVVPKELVPLQGTWTLAYAERDGERVSQDELVNRKIVLVIKGDSVFISHGSAPAKEYWIAADRDKNPKVIDWYATTVIQSGREEAQRVISGKFLEFVGIYAIEDKTLKMCLSPHISERPDAFVTKGLDLVVINREE